MASAEVSITVCVIIRPCLTCFRMDVDIESLVHLEQSCVVTVVTYHR